MNDIEPDTALAGEVMDVIVAHRKLGKNSYRSGLDPDEEIAGLTNVFSKYEGSYEWESFGAWRDDNRFYWFHDVGCSGFGPGEDIRTLADMENGDASALVRAYKVWASETAYHLSGNDKVEAEAQIRAAIRESR